MRESVIRGNVIRESWPVTREKLWRWNLRLFRAMIWTADEWVHTQEVKLQSRVTTHESRVTDSSCDRVASSIREHARRRVAKFQKLKYAGGQFVRQEPL